MDLRKLRHVVAVAHTLSFVRAGDAVGLSQSALTRSIQSVERETGLRLFDRDRGQVRLTRQGRLFVDRAEALLKAADDLDRSLRRASVGEEGEIPFGMEPLPARALLPKVLSGAIASSPHMCNRVVIRSIEALWTLLLAGDIDFFISAESRVPANPSVRTAVLGSFPLSFLVRAGHPALTASSEERPYPVLLAGDAGDFDHVSPRLRTLISGPRHIIEDYDILARLTASSDGILISSTMAVQTEFADGRISEIPPDDGYPARSMRIVMYTLERRSLSPGAVKLKGAFVEQMRAATQSTSMESENATLG